MPEASEESGRMVGAVRLPPAVTRDEDLQIAATYRELFNELLRSTTVPFSGQGPDEEPDSEPDEEDGGFLEAVIALEQYRSRPSSRGGPARGGMFGPIPTTREGLGVDFVIPRAWDTIPRGAVSEWSPVMPLAGPENVCMACRAVGGERC